jgi:hypothetical protein
MFFEKRVKQHRIHRSWRSDGKLFDCQQKAAI